MKETQALGLLTEFCTFWWEINLSNYAGKYQVQKDHYNWHSEYTAQEKDLIQR